MKKLMLTAAALATSAMLSAPALAQSNEITIGISIATTGPAAALGIPERNALEFVPKEIGGVKLNIIVLDDGGDPTAATTNARRFVTESKADVIMGSSTTPPSVAISTVANEAGVPHLGLAPFPINEQRAKWSVMLPQAVPRPAGKACRTRPGKYDSCAGIPMSVSRAYCRRGRANACRQRRRPVRFRPTILREPPSAIRESA